MELIQEVVGMIGFIKALPFLAVGVVAGFAGYQTGHRFGHGAGVATQIEAQKLIDAQEKLKIEKAVRNAIDDIGADVSNDDLDAILRALSGERTGPQLGDL